MRSLFLSLSVPALLALAAAAPARRARAGDATRDATPSARLTWRPEEPLQGTLFVLRVAPEPGTEVAGVEGAVAGEALHFERAADGSFASLAPVPVQTEGVLPVHVVVRDAAGVETGVDARVPVRSGTYHHERLTVAPEMGAPLQGEAARRLARDQAKANEVARRAHATPQLWRGPAALPRDARITGEFGDGRVFNGQVSSRHLGLDLQGSVGDTVRAAERGVVALVDSFLLAGNIVYLVHGDGLLSGYFHLSRPLVAEGDTVEAGTPIGLVGATGRVTGPHLHWVVRYGTTSVDPRSFLDVTR
jgi:murein DD-endopeptidase MepM/ murein hydrolase activator NlpD